MNILIIPSIHPVLQEGKQAVVARSEITAPRRVVKQLPVEVLQHCSSSISCMLTHFVMEDYYAVCQHSTPFVLNDATQLVVLVFRNTLLTLLWFLVALIPSLALTGRELPSAFRQATFV
jgi:hypothetical protein